MIFSSAGLTVFLVDRGPPRASKGQTLRTPLIRNAIAKTEIILQG